MHVEQPHVYELLNLWRAGKIKPESVRLGPMPKHATIAMRAVADDIERRLGLLLAEGVTRALPYARSEAVRAGHVGTLRGASYVLGRLVDEGVIRYVGEMPKLGKGNGTRLYVPPGWRPVEPPAVAIERGGQQGLADLVWIPDQPGDAAGAAAEQPHVEFGEQRLVDGLSGEHGPENTDRPGRISADDQARLDDLATRHEEAR